LLQSTYVDIDLKGFETDIIIYLILDLKLILCL